MLLELGINHQIHICFTKLYYLVLSVLLSLTHRHITLHWIKSVLKCWHWFVDRNRHQREGMKTTWKMCTVRLSPDSPPWHGPLQFQGAMLMLHYHPLLFILPRCFGRSTMSSVMVIHVCEHRGRGLTVIWQGKVHVSCEHTIKRGGVKVGGEGKNLDAHMHWF